MTHLNYIYGQYPTVTPSSLMALFASSPDRRQARNYAIRADFAMMQKKHLRHDHIIDSLCSKYYLAPSTVYAIVGSTGRYRATSGHATA